MARATLKFTPGFLWGTATSAHQVEGNNTLNDWWAWEQQPGHIYKNQSSGIACNWWENAEEDFDRAAEMNTNAHRLSVEWSRIEPEPGKWDDSALDRYRQMVSGLRERGIEPMVTLHHFTNPMWLAEQGGWENPDVVTLFARFARKVVETLGEHVSLWCTLNEPIVLATQSYGFGRWPPGKRSRKAMRRVVVNQLRAHAAAYEAIKEAQPDARIGLAKNMIAVSPARPAWIHRPAARAVRYTFNEAFLLALRDGALKFPGSRTIQLPEVKGSLDWIGVNYYSRYFGRFDLLSPSSFFINASPPSDPERSPAPGWGETYPRGLFENIRYLWETLGLPIYVTENGIPDHEDKKRPAFLLESLKALWDAVNYSWPIRGYFFWSLVDNFEWSEGYDPRFSFGLIEVDFETQERRWRPSGRLYAEICAANGFSSDMAERYAPEVLGRLFPGSPPE